VGELQRAEGSQVYLHKVIRPADFTETFIVSQHNKLIEDYKLYESPVTNPKLNPHTALPSSSHHTCTIDVNTNAT
jgi:hypothetical protein